MNAPKAKTRVQQDRTPHQVGDTVLWGKPHKDETGRLTGRTVTTECVIVHVTKHQFRLRCGDGTTVRAYHENVRAP